jgi:uncharacterized protein (TIGR02611 family)
MDASTERPAAGGDYTVATSQPRAASRMLHQTRAMIRRHPRADRVYRTSVGVAGAGTIALGVVLIPLPGPGSLIALGGLALLGTEFEGAKKTSKAANTAARRMAARAKQAKQNYDARKAGQSG